MSQHSQRTQDGPTGASVATGALLVAVSAVLTGYVTSGPGWDAQKVVATVLGVALTGMLLIRVLGLSAERAVAQDRMAREADLASQRAERERAGFEHVVTAADAKRYQRMVDDELQSWVDQRRAQEEEWRWKTERQRLEVSADLPEPDPIMVDHWANGGEPPQEPYLQPDPDYPSEEGPVVYPEPSPAAVARWAAAGQPDPVYRNPLLGPVEVDRELDQAVTGYLDEELDPAGYPATQPPYLARVPMPLPPRQPDGYVDPGPYSSWVPPRAAAPVSPGRPDPGYIDCDGTCGDRGCPAFVDLQDRVARDWPTETIRRVDEDATEVISCVR